MSALLENAVRLAEKHGKSIFPCKEGGKSPLTSDGCKAATKDTAIIERWWRRFPNANIGIAAGSVSDGLLVIDVDGEEGQNSIDRFTKEHGQLPLCPTVITGRGYQLYYRSDKQEKNRVGILPGIDVRSDGGYVIAPPSLHPSGKIYHWKDGLNLDSISIPKLPEAFQKLFNSEKHTRSATTKRELYFAKNGERNSKLAQITGYLLGKNVEPTLAYHLLQAWNQCLTESPLDAQEFNQTVTSIKRLHERNQSK